MSTLDELDGFDVVPPRTPITVSLELSPDEIELALATKAGSLRLKLLTELVLAMIQDRTLASQVERRPRKSK